MLSNNKLYPKVAELFIRGRKLKISLILLCQKNMRLNFMQYLIMKIPNKGELQQIVFNHLSDIDFKDFMNLLQKMYCKTLFFFSY